jgi:hypothetical protein
MNVLTHANFSISQVDFDLSINNNPADHEKTNLFVVVRWRNGIDRLQLYHDI